MSPSPIHTAEPTSTQPLAAGPRLVQSIALGNFLSFGPEMPCLPLANLNVLVGPNGSGKSNLLEALSLLRSAPTDLRPVIARGGGIGEWIWKGNPHGCATLEAIFVNPSGSQPLRHVLAFRAEQQSFRLDNEQIDQGQLPGRRAVLRYHYRRGRPVIGTQKGEKRNLRPETVQPDLSILAQLRDPESYPEIT
jgi:predicted ATPase